MFYLTLVLALFSVFYVPRRLQKILGQKKFFWPFFAVALIVVVGYASVIATGFYASDNLLAAGLFDVLGVLLIFHAYFFIFILLTQPFAKFLVGRRGKLVLIAGTGLTFCLVAFGLWNAMSFRLTHFEVKTPGLTKPLVIIHAPDLHLGAARGEGFLRKVLAAIESQNPDLVIYNGDLVDSDIALKPEIFDLFKGVAAPQFFTSGNHEYYVNTEKELSLIQGAGVRFLRSESVDLGEVNLIGLLYMNGDKAAPGSHRVNDLFMDEELPKIQRDKSKPTVLVHHSPVGTRHAQAGGAFLYLAGHTHGGQVFPGTVMIKATFPYYNGRYELDGMTLLVSQGVGTFGPPLRLGTFAEIQVVTLVPAG